MTEHDDTPRDPALSHRYREACDARDMAPPPALDARILAEAREAVQPPAVAPHPRPWWRRLVLPVGVMASTLLAVMLSLTVQQHTPEILEHDAREPKAIHAPAAPTSARPSAVQESAPRHPAAAERIDGAAPAPAVSAVPVERVEGNERRARAADKKAAPQSAAPVPVAPAAPSPSPAAAAVSNAASAAGAVAPALPLQPTVAGEAAAVSPRQKAEVTADHAQEAETSTPLQKAAPAAAAPVRLGASRGEASPTAQAWLEEIRELRRQGRQEEAAQRLAEFRKAYPGHAVPEDLRN